MTMTMTMISTMTIDIGLVYRVRTDPGKVWKVLEINVEIFKALNTLENDHRYGKVWKILENCNTDLEGADVNCTVDYP